MEGMNIFKEIETITKEDLSKIPSKEFEAVITKVEQAMKSYHKEQEEKPILRVTFENASLEFREVKEIPVYSKEKLIRG